MFFEERGKLIPEKHNVVNLIDFDYGSEPGKNDYWHTVQDTMDKISDTSLLKAGMLVAEVLNMLEGNEK